MKNVQFKIILLLLVSFLIPVASRAAEVIGLPNPLGTSDPAVIIGRIIRTFTGFAGGIGLMMFVYGGFIWLTSFGNPERIKKGQDLLLWATIGLAIMFSSYIVAKYIITAVTRGTGAV